MVIDLLVLALVALAAWTGWRMGASAFVLRLLGAVLGLVLGLLLAHAATRLLPPLSPVASLAVTVGCALGGLLVGSSLGGRIGGSVRFVLWRAHLGVLDRAAGAVARGFAALVVLTAVAAVVAAAGPAQWTAVIRGSALLNAVPLSLPPAVRAVVPAGVAGLVPASHAQLPASSLVRRIALADGDGVLPVAAAGCGTGVSGTAFVAAPSLVVTNAHVVRGATAVSIGGHRATVLVVDLRADLAVLRVDGVGDALPLASSAAVNGSSAVVLGYPEGGPERAVPAVVLQRLPVPVPGLADGPALHEAYLVRADVRHGNSGSPLLDSSGRVLGVINALAGPDAYATTVAELLPDLRAARSASSPASTGACAA